VLGVADDNRRFMEVRVIGFDGRAGVFVAKAQCLPACAGVLSGPKD